MRVPYRRYAVEGGTIARPVLTIELVSRLRALQFDALVDSGADLTLLPTELAEHAGVRLGKESRVNVTAAGGQTLPVRFQLLTLRLPNNGVSWRWRARVGFAAGLEHALLGQQGFLEFFRCCLDGRRAMLEITAGTRVRRVR